MDRTSVIGLILGIVAVGAGLFISGVSPAALLNPAAIIMIILGTVAVIFIAFPTSEVKNIPSLLKVIFQEEEQEQASLILLFSDLAQLARREGILALESKIEEIDDPFFKRGLRFAIDGQTADYIRDVLNEEVYAMEKRHEANASIFSQAGTYAPTLGVLGAVVGLIAALGNLDNTDELGLAIAAAFVATLFGIFTGYVMWHPFANKLKRKSEKEVERKEMIIEGILSVLEGEAPRVIEEKLSSYLSADEREQLFASSEVDEQEEEDVEETEE